MVDKTAEEKIILKYLKAEKGKLTFKELQKKVCGDLNLTLISLKLKSLITYKGIIPTPQTKIILIKKKGFYKVMKRIPEITIMHFIIIVFMLTFGIL
ncbi:MAG: hypothetical protein ACTSR8_15720 [Promethearchaeota archaeon]